MSPVELSLAGVKSLKQWNLLDWDRTLAVVETWEQLEAALVSVPQRAVHPNAIVDLVSPAGDTLSVGIAGPLDGDNPELKEPLTCLNFTDASRNPPYLTVVGDASLTFEKGGVIVFRYEQGTWTEILRRNCVSLDLMLPIVKHFFQTGALPHWIGWEEV